MDLSNIKQARYIKLGAGGEWESLCLGDGTLRINYYEVTEELGVQGNKASIRDLFVGLGITPTAASNHARQVIDFYHCVEDTLWVTFSGGYLWWAVSDSEVEYRGSNQEECAPEGNHVRKTIDGWHNTSLSGEVLHMCDLSGQFTSVAAYRQTICDIKEKAFDYLIRKLNDQDLPEVLAAKQARDEMLKTTKELIQLLTWQDFELFVDLIFSQSGWRRISSLGSTQKTLDLELVLPTTGERAIVQVKSKTNQKQLNEYVEKFSTMNAEKYFYIYHSSSKTLNVPNGKITLIGPERLSEQSMDAGLTDWLIKKVG